MLTTRQGFSRVRAARRGTGHTLLELAVAVGLLSTAFVVVGATFARLSEAFSQVAKLSFVVSRAPATMDRLVDELRNGRILDPAVPAASDYIRFDRITGVVAGAPVYGDPIQIDVVGMEASITDSKDNDGDGIIDEGAIRIWTDVAPLGTTPGNEDEAVVIASGIGKDGLQFTLQGSMVIVDLTFEETPEAGEDSTTFTLSTGVITQ